MEENADFSQSCFILDLDEMSSESLDIWREGHLTDDSDLEILSGLIRLCPDFGVLIHHFPLNYALTSNIYQTDMLWIT